MKSWAEKKSHRPHWDNDKPATDPWEATMLKDCAEITILAGKKKKGPDRSLRKKLTLRTTLLELAQIADAKGGPQAVEFQINGRKFHIEAHRVTCTPIEAPQ
jgi:hypothetical protein